MIGVDIVRNERIAQALDRFGERFLRRVYTQEELEYCRSLKDFIPCLAARWACKEAVLKAFYMEFGILLRFNEISVKGRRGLPARVEIKRKGVEELLKGRSLEVSISHERDYSVAVALIR